jgi:arylsulfatase A-like enzyme
MFVDDWKPERKRNGPFSGAFHQRRLNRERRRYDEYIANVDAELGRLFDFMRSSGLLENTYLILTSDHGEMFERGIWGHLTPTLYEPVIRTPLVIVKPGQAHRQDIHINTSCVDILPTILSLAGLDIPEECEGEILPPFNGSRDDPQRTIFCLEAKTNPKQSPLTTASFALLKGSDKLIHYIGYNMDEKYKSEMYHLAGDPEEMKDLYSKSDPLARELQEILLSKIDEVNEKYT